MASYPVTVYRWDDPGAPQLDNGKVSSFFDILQKCLVEGYGTQSPLGWSQSYYDPENFKSAWRNNVAAGGSGGSAYFYSNTGTDVNQTIVRITSCKAITSAGVITGRGRLMAIQIPTAISRWVLIGSAIGFYFYTFGATGTDILINSSSQTPCFYMGDIFSVIPNDAGRFVAACNLVDSTSESVTYSTARYLSYSNNISNGVPLSFTIQDADGNNSSKNYPFSCGLSTSSGDNIVSPNLLPHIFSPFLITESGSFVNNSSRTDRLNLPLKNSTVSPSFRGALPGFYGLLNGLGYGQEMPFIFNDGLDVYHLLGSISAAESSRMVIKTGAWNDPFA